MDTALKLEMECALQAVYFATRHLDLAATTLDLIDAPKAARARVALARTEASRALSAIAERLPVESEASRLGVEPVPF